MKRRRIGELYDKELFLPAFEAAADRLVSKVMGEFADTEKGEAARSQAVENLKNRIKEVPIEYYRTLEAFINGEDVTKYARFTRSEEELEYFKSTQKKGLIDLIAAHTDGSWVVKNPLEDEKYYELRFELNGKKKEKKPKQNGAEQMVENIAQVRRMVEEQTREHLVSFDFEARRIRRKRVESYKDMRREHAAFIMEKSDIDKRDPAYRLLGGLYSEFKREYKMLSHMEDMVMRVRRKLIPLELLVEHGLATERQRSRHDALKEREKISTRDLECYMNALDEMNEVRYKNGIISEQLYLRKTGEKSENTTRPTAVTSPESEKGEQINLSLRRDGRTLTEPIKEQNAREITSGEIDKSKE